MTAAFLQFLLDQELNWREVAADLVMYGHFDPHSRVEDQNPGVVRGKLLCIKMLREIDIGTIQGFYQAQLEASEADED